MSSDTKFNKEPSSTLGITYDYVINYNQFKWCPRQASLPTICFRKVRAQSVGAEITASYAWYLIYEYYPANNSSAFFINNIRVWYKQLTHLATMSF